MLNKVLAVVDHTALEVTHYGNVPQLRKPTQVLLALLMLQLGFGLVDFTAYLNIASIALNR